MSAANSQTPGEPAGDIRVTAEAALRASEERLRMAVRVAGVTTWEWDAATGTIQYYENAKALAHGEDLARYSSVAALLQEVHPDDRARLTQTLEQALAEQRAFECEYRVRMLDGAYHWILGKGETWVMEEGKPRRVVGVSIDITARKRAELIQQALLNLGTQLNTVHTPEEAARAILATADSLWTWDCATLDVYIAETDRMEPVLNWDIVDGQRREVPSVCAAGAPTPRMRRIMQEGPKLILRTPSDPVPGDAVLLGDTSRLSASILCVPLRREGQPVGVMSIQSYTPGAYNREDLLALQALADHGGGALERLRTTRELRAMLETLERRVEDRTAELRATNAALRESGRRLTTLMANLPGMVYRCRNDSQWTMEFVSPGCLGLTGYPASDVVSNCRVAFATIIHPEDRPGVWERVQQALAQRQPFQVSYRITTANGLEKWAWEQGRGVYDADGQLLALEGFITDVTATRRAEAALRESENLHRSIVEGAQEGIWKTDAQWRITFVNARLLEMFGYPAEAMMGRSILEFMDDEERAAAPEKMRAREMGVRQAHEAKFRRQNGSELWTLVSGTPLLDERGQFAGALALLTDITELKHSEQTLKRYTDALRELSSRLLDAQEAERRMLARELHDEVGQSLTTLRLALDRSLEDASAPNREALEHARSVLQDLVTRVRNLSLDLRPSMLDDLGLVPALLWQFEHYTAQTRIQVRFSQSQMEGRRLGPLVETAAYRVVQEALTNVARHAGVSEVSVRVSAGAEGLQVQIQDHGRGFDPATALAAGHSNGLRGMLERASLLGGKVEINSDPGAGTFVLAEFPLREPGAAPRVELGV